MLNPITALFNLFQDDNDRSLARQEIARRNIQEAKLTHFAQTGELPPAPERMENLTRGSNDAEPAWLRALLTKYQLRLEHNAQGDPARLVDTKYDGLTNKVFEIHPNEMLFAGLEKWEKVAKSAHFAIRARAIRAGLQKPNPRRGNPGKTKGGE